jgi:hypothetical protein
MTECSHRIELLEPIGTHRFLCRQCEQIVTSRQLGLNPRALGRNPRALGVNPIALGTNPKALHPWRRLKRKRRR